MKYDERFEDDLFIIIRRIVSSLDMPHERDAEGGWEERTVVFSSRNLNVNALITPCSIASPENVACTMRSTCYRDVDYQLAADSEEGRMMLAHFGFRSGSLRFGS